MTVVGADAPSRFMERALEMAAAVRGRTSPNPWVGAVLVRNGEIVAEGATEPPGGRHAEACALAAAPPGRGGTLYVTLEPCSPFPGKRTPPCSEAVVAAGLDRVVVALEDPDPGVSGAGLAILRAAGVEVEVGDGAPEARALLRPYLKHRSTGLPYVIAKFAASLDGRTATPSGDSRWITGELARERVHVERARVDAIVAGSGTVSVDDPALTARPGGTATDRQPLRVIVDGRGRTPATARVLREPGNVIIATTARAPLPWRTEMTAAGAQIVLCESADPGVNLHQLLQALGRRGVLSAWVEGGATLLGSLFDGGHVDEIWAFIAPVILGGGLPAIAGAGTDRIADAWRLRTPVTELLPPDLLVRGYVVIGMGSADCAHEPSTLTVSRPIVC